MADGAVHRAPYHVAQGLTAWAAETYGDLNGRLIREIGRGWQKLPARDMLDLIESTLVDEVERQLAVAPNEENGVGRASARKAVDEMLYRQQIGAISRDELAKTWGKRPEHQTGLAAAVGVVKAAE